MILLSTVNFRGNEDLHLKNTTLRDYDVSQEFLKL